MASQVDWEAIEAEYRAGQFSIAEIGRRNGISHVAILKRAKKEGWTRDLPQKVRQEVTAKLVTEGVTACNTRDVIEQAVARDIAVLREHRGVIGRGRDLTLRLLDELDATTSKVGELTDLIDEDTKGEKNPRRRDGMHRAVSLPSRVGVIKDLSTAAKNWIALERQAFNIETQSPDEEPATKADVRSAVSNLTIDQLKQLRSIHSSAFGSAEPQEGD